MSAWRIAVLMWLGSVCSPAPAQQFSRRYDPLGQHAAQSSWGIEKTMSGGYVCIANCAWSDSFYYSSVVLTIHIDLEGNELAEHRWEYPTRATYPGWTNSSEALQNGDFIVCGNTVDTLGEYRLALFRLNHDGEPLEVIEYDSLSIGGQVKVDRDGGYLLCGQEVITTTADALIQKTDSMGVVQWRAAYGEPTTNESVVSLSLAPSGGYYLGGLRRYPDMILKPWVLRVDAQGELLWEHTYGEPLGFAPNAHIETLADSSCVFASAFPQQAGPGGILCMVKIDPDGNTLWSHTYGANAFDNTFFAVKEVEPFGDLITCGQSYQENSDRKGVLLRTNSDGDSLWMRHYFYADSLLDDGEGTLRDVLPTEDGGFIAVGAVNGSASGNNPPQYNQDIWVVKVDSLGCLVPGCDDFTTAITVQVTNLKEALAVYPNPAHGSTTVNVTLPRSTPFLGELRLRMVSAHGQEVIDQPAVQGENQLSLRDLAGGIYYVHLTSGSTWLSGTKLIVE